MNSFCCQPRLVRWSLRLSLWLGLPAGMFVAASITSTNQEAFNLFGALFLIFGYWPTRWYAELLTPFFVTMIKCPRCGLEREAVGIWGTGSYTDHVERHILRFKNPIDGSRVGYMDCTECGSTILVR